MNYCEYCKASLEDTANYCINCGKSIQHPTSNKVPRKKENFFIKASQISFGIVIISAIASSIYQTNFFNKMGISVPPELYGEIFGRFFGYGLLAVPLVYLFLKLKNA